MSVTKPEVAVLISALLFMLTQLSKEVWPTFMDKYGKYLAVFLAFLGAVGSVTVYLAANNGNIVAANNWDAALVLFREVVFGIGLGLSAVGLYNVGRLAPTVIRSTDEILVAKTSLTASGEVAVPVSTTEVVVETVELKSKTPKKAKA